MRQTSGSLFWLLCVVVACFITARPAAAGPWISTGNSSDGFLAAQAEFTITNHQIQVTITNLLSPTAIVSAGQAVSDLIFTISNAPGTNTSNAAAGAMVTIGAGGTHSSASGAPGRWVGLEPGLGSFGISGDTITLEAIGGGKPSEMILPFDNGGNYSSANASITQNFSPYTDGPATFTLNLSGVTTSTKITSVTLSFGTSPDFTMPAHFVLDNPPVPEPGSLAVWTLLGLAGIVHRRRRIAA